MICDPQQVVRAAEKMGLKLWVIHPDTGLFEQDGLYESLGHGSSGGPKDMDSFLEWVHVEDVRQFRQSIVAHLSGNSEKVQVEIRILGADGHYYWRALMGAVVQDGGVRKLIGFCLDIHHRRSNEEKLHLLATKDNLTGAYNKNMGMLLCEKLRQQCIYETKPMRLMMFELPNFKALNELHGLEAGNLLIQGLSQILRENSSAGDVFCRLEGVSFILLQAGQDESTVNELVSKIDVRVQEFNVRNSHEYALSYRWGFSETHRPGTDTMEILLSRARYHLGLRARGKA